MVYGTEDIAPYIEKGRADFRVLMALAFLTGARLGELVALKKKDFWIDESRDEMRIILKTLKRKGDFNRELIFSIKADPFVQDMIAPFVRMVQSDAAPLFKKTRRSYQMELLRLNKDIHSDITTGYITFHQLRHSAITYLARELRASAWEIASWTGHKSTAYEEYMIHGATTRFKGRMRR